MALRLDHAWMRSLPELRWQPVVKRVTVRLGDELVAVTDHPVLVFEPQARRGVVRRPAGRPAGRARAGTHRPAAGPPPGRLRRGRPAAARPERAVRGATRRTGSRSWSRAAGRSRRRRSGSPTPTCTDYVVLDFDDFDWWEEDEPHASATPRDPFHRIDVRRSSRPVRISARGSRAGRDRPSPAMLFEGDLPAAALLPAARGRRGRPAHARTLDTTCAYKGRATHYDVRAGDAVLPTAAWTYEDPLDDARDVDRPGQLLPGAARPRGGRRAAGAGPDALVGVTRQSVPAMAAATAFGHLGVEDRRDDEVRVELLVA